MWKRLYRGRDGVVVTFNYGHGELRTLRAYSRLDAYERARRRWGGDWLGEPCVSSPFSIWRDITGETKRRHGGRMGGMQNTTDERKSQRWRTGR